MVSFKRIEEANRQRSFSSPRTALFVGATSGIGLGTIEALLRSIKGCTIIIVGRSETKFTAKLSRLQKLDRSASITFIEAQVSLLRDVDRVCRIVSKQCDTLDLLWLSQGGLGLRENNGDTGEGLPVDFAVSFHGRVLFMQKMAPLLSGSKDGRVVSVLCAGYEGPIINAADPALQAEGSYAHAGFWGAQKQGITMHSLGMKQLAAEHPDVAFIHTNPGAVSTDLHEKWSASFTGIWTPIAWLIRYVLVFLFAVVGMSPTQAGEVGLYIALEERFGGQAGGNFHRVDEKAEKVARKGSEILAGYVKDGTSARIWEHTVAVFERVLGSS